MSENKKKKTDIKRKVTNFKEDIFNTYVRVLMFMIENKGKSFLNKDIRYSIFGDDKSIPIKNMVNRCIDFYVSSGILIKVTILKDKNGNDTEVVVDKDSYDKCDKKFEVDFNGVDVNVKPYNVKVRLYDKDIDGVDEEGNYYDDYYLVDLHIPKSRDGRENLCQTVASMFTHIPDSDIYTPAIKKVLESQLFGFNTDFVTQTISKSILRKQNIINQCNKQNGFYSMDIITSIMKSQININVTFENFGNTIQLKNTKIRRISIKENGFDIHFDNFISQNQSDLNQITYIENTSEDGLRSDVDKLNELSKTIDDETIKKVIEDIVRFEKGVDIFTF